MPRVGTYLSLTLDGMYAGPNGELDFGAPNEEEHRYANDVTRAGGDFVMSRGVYDVMAYWDELDLDDPAVNDVEREFATLWRERHKHVVSRGRPELRANASLLQGDPVEAVRAMRAGEGPPISLGAGAELFGALAAAGLIDDFRFRIVPTVLGRGKALFAALPSPLDLRLVRSHTYDSGGVLLEYVRADE